MTLQIPKKHQKPFRDFAALNSSKRKAFIKDLSGCSPSLFMGSLVEELAQKSKLTKPEINAFITILGSIYRSKLIAGEEPEIFVNDICEAGKLLFKKAKDNRKVDWNDFAKDILDALSNEEPLLTTKASEVSTSHQKVFASTRVLTDIRPIFYDDTAKMPKTVVVIHNLSISYYKDGEQKTFYVSLDIEDVRELKKHLDRALEKDSTLISFLDKNSIVWLKPPGGCDDTT